jgi:hypothetical protein
MALYYTITFNQGYEHNQTQAFLLYFTVLTALILLSVFGNIGLAQQAPKKLPYSLAGDIKQHTVVPGCGFDYQMKLNRLNADYVAREALMNQQIRNVFAKGLNDTLTLPVVFHIIHNNPSAVTDAVILNALKDFNPNFALENILRYCQLCKFVQWNTNTPMIR